MNIGTIIEKFIETLIFHRIVFTLLVIIFFWFVGRINARFLDHKIKDVKLRYTWGKTSLYILTGLGFIVTGMIWFEGMQSIATFLGLLSAGLAIALKDLVANLFGWVFIMWRKPFEVGNRIQIGQQSGDVIDIRPFQFTILEIGNWVNGDQSTGRMVHVPNSFLFNQSLFNYDRGFNYIWNELHITVTFESNWKKAKNILQEIADSNALPATSDVEEQIQKAAKHFMIIYKVLTPKVYTTIEDSGVLLSVRYLCDVKKRRSTTEIISESILEEFSKHNDIDFAYPTTRFYNNIMEGKPQKKTTEENK